MLLLRTVFISLVLTSLACCSGNKSPFVGAKFALEVYNCRPCVGCTIHISSASNYEVIENQIVVFEGKWRLERGIDMTHDLISFDNGPGNFYPRNGEAVPYINLVDCNERFSASLLNSFFEGRVLEAIPDPGSRNRFMLKLEDFNSGKIIIDTPKVPWHPWLHKYYSPGDYIRKDSGSLCYYYIGHDLDTLKRCFQEF